MQIIMLLIVLSADTAGCRGVYADNNNTVVIGSDRQLFIDFTLVESRRNIKLVMNRPIKRGIVLPADKPWENYRMGSYGEVFEDDGIYRMWYESSYKERNGEKGETRSRSVTCYAESKDGIAWEKPPINNTAFREYGFLRRPVNKYVFYFRGWTHNLMRTVVRFEADDFLAPWPVAKPGPQSLYKHEARYPAITNEAQVVIKTGENDPDPSDYYNPAVVKYPAAPNVYLAFPSMFFHFPDPPMGKALSEDDFVFSPGLEPPYTHIPRHYDAPATPEMEKRGVTTRNSGFLDIRMLISRDGITWNRDCKLFAFQFE